jgi:uncharacterized Zn finger protein (UPF0148 family)
MEWGVLQAMSPLFPCSGCGVQIERSMRLYRDQKGTVLCSTCKDKLEVDQASQPSPSAAQSQKPQSWR